MRTAAIRSRARAALPGLALLLTAAVVVAIVFVVQWAMPEQMHTYQTYSPEVTPAPPWHPGQSLSLQWVPDEAGQTGPEDAVPRAVMCTFLLFGPYATRTAAQADATAPLPAADPSSNDRYTLYGSAPAVSAPPLTLSTAQGTEPAPVTYTLPTALAPGYYVAVGLADDANAGGGGASVSWVVEVAA